MVATIVFTAQNVLNNDKFAWQLITECDVQISYSILKLKTLQCVHFLKGDTIMLRHTTRVEPITLVTMQKTPKWRFQDSPQFGRRFPLAKMPTFRRRRGQHLLNHFNFINFHNQVVVHITRWLPFQVSNTGIMFVFLISNIFIITNVAYFNQHNSLQFPRTFGWMVILRTVCHHGTFEKLLQAFPVPRMLDLHKQSKNSPCE